MPDKKDEEQDSVFSAEPHDGDSTWHDDVSITSKVELMSEGGPRSKESWRSKEVTNIKNSSTINVDSDIEIFNGDETSHDYNVCSNRTLNYDHLHFHQYLQQNSTPSNALDRGECYQACVKSIFSAEDCIGLNQMSVDKVIKVLGKKARIAVLKEIMQIEGWNITNLVDKELLYWNMRK